MNLPALPSGQSYSVTATFTTSAINGNSFSAELKDNQIVVQNVASYINSVSGLAFNDITGDYSNDVTSAISITYIVSANNTTYLTYNYTQNVVINPYLFSYNNTQTLTGYYNIANGNIGNSSNVTLDYNTLGKQLLNVSYLKFLNTNKDANVLVNNSDSVTATNVTFTDTGVTIPSEDLGWTVNNSYNVYIKFYFSNASIEDSLMAVTSNVTTSNVTFNQGSSINTADVINNSITIPNTNYESFWNSTAYGNNSFSLSGLSNYVGNDLVTYMTMQGTTADTILNIVSITSANENDSSFSYFASNTELQTFIQNISNGEEVGLGVTIASPQTISSNSLQAGYSYDFSFGFTTGVIGLTTTYDPTFALTSNISSIAIESNGDFTTPLTITVTPSTQTSLMYDLSNVLLYGGNINAGLWSQLHTGTNSFNSLSDLFDGNGYNSNTGKYTSTLTDFLKNNATFVYSLVGGLYTKGLASSPTSNELTSAAVSANSSNQITFNFSKKN